VFEYLWAVFEEYENAEAMVWRDKSFSYGMLLENIHGFGSTLTSRGIPRGTVAAIEGDFSPNSVALFLALAEHGCIIVPLTASVEAKKPEFRSVAQVEVTFRLDGADQLSIVMHDRTAEHPLYLTLRQRANPGLVLFSSGSTGRSKAAVHDLAKLLEKFTVRRRRLRTITFLLYDHIGGVNTLLYTLSNGGCVITVEDRDPDAVLSTVERHGAELLPTSPTFLNLVLLSEAWTRYDLKSLRTITYGTEPMPESTLRRIHEVIPRANLQQTYGLSEVGILRSKSEGSNSLWVKVGGDGFETKIVDGILWIRARSAMLGYLNAPNPFDEDGWLNTGDQVEVDGEYIRFLGRKSEIINVGGEKVFPVEVESVLQQMEGIRDVAVSGEINPITGQIVKALVELTTDESAVAFRKRMRAFCRKFLPTYKIPQKIVLTKRKLHSARFKKMRNNFDN